MSDTRMDAIRHLINTGYIPAAPTRALLETLTSEGVILQRLGGAIGTEPATLRKIRCGTVQWVHRSLAETLAALDVEDIIDRCSIPAAYVDELTLDRILAGERVVIAAYDKPAYARVLHTRHGWSANRISKVLRINWTRMPEILGAAA